jgi:Bacterial regulatory helix-turn-helix protein, lysR family
MTEGNSSMNRGDLSDLNTFLAITDHLSFRAAAAQLGVTSSALSHSIRQLEGCSRRSEARKAASLRLHLERAAFC